MFLLGDFENKKNKKIQKNSRRRYRYAAELAGDVGGARTTGTAQRTKHTRKDSRKKTVNHTTVKQGASLTETMSSATVEPVNRGQTINTRAEK